MYESHPNSHIEILMFNTMLLGGVAFKNCLGHEDGALVSEISVLIKDPTEIPVPFLHVWTQGEDTIYKPESGFSQTSNLSMHDLRLLSLQNNKKCISVVYKLSSLWYFITEVQINQDGQKQHSEDFWLCCCEIFHIEFFMDCRKIGTQR